MSEKDRERLAAFAEAAKTGSAPPPPLALEELTEPTQINRHDEISIPPLSPRTASAALRGFIPYGDDPSRQDRYRSYLSSQTLNTETPNPTFRAGSIEQINKELEDFAASARIFKPMSFAMSNRFTSGSSALASTDLKQPAPGLHMYDAERAKQEAERKAVVPEAPKRVFKSPKEEAAANGVYGQLTREVRTFYPDKLLTKRFGIPNPYPDGDPSKNTGGSKTEVDDAPLPTNDASWSDAFIHKPSDTPSAPVEVVEEGERRPKTLADVGMADDINQGRDTLSYTKPSIDIFKAIFASDDEEDDDDDDNDKAAAPSAIAKPASTKQVGEDPYPVKEEGPVDLATFKPVFNVRKDDGRKDGKKKDKKDKKKRKGVLSFDVGEDGDEEIDRDEEKKRRKKDTERKDKIGEKEKEKVDAMKGVSEEQPEEEEVWVEKAAPAPRAIGRKGAADYM